MGLENLLEEFFSPATGNARKQEIEKVLTSFSNQTTAWRDCLYFITHSRNQFVAMYCLTTLEQVIRCRWLGMVSSEKEEIRSAFNQFVFQPNNKGYPPFVRTKMMKLVVDIAKVDWPHFYPNFFPQILHLIHAQESIVEGLTILLIACEELGAPREDLSSSRAAELRKLMNAQASHISLTLTNILESVLDREGSSTNTPPPSPSLSGDSEDSNSMDGSIFTASPLHTGSLIQAASTKVLSPGVRRSSPCQLTLDAQSVQVSSLALQIFAQLMSWTELHLVVSTRVLNMLTQFSSLTLRRKVGQPQVGGITELSVLAMAALNEVLGKNYAPPDYQGFLTTVYRGTLSILQNLVSESEGSGGAIPVHHVDSAFLEKITDFLKYFVAFHLKRCELNNQFPLLEFLSLTFKYSFQQPSIAGFGSCLEIWNALVDYVQGAMEIDKEGGKGILSRYQEALLSLVFQLLKKIQYRYNSEQLIHLDHSRSSEEQESEWETFLISSIETIMKVAELLPLEVLRITDSVWKETCVVYLDLEKIIISAGGPQPSRLQLSSKEEELKLDYMLKDFSTMLQLIGRMSVLFLGEEFLVRLETGLEYMKQLLALAAFASRHKLYSAASCDSTVIKQDFLVVHAQTLATLKAWCHWLAALHSEALNDSSYTWVSSDITSRIVSAVVIVVKEGENEKLVHAAAHFLVTLTGTVRPPSIWKLKEFTDLYSSIRHLRLQPEAHRLLTRSLCNVLLLHWPGITEQKWEDRRKHLTKFLRDITEEFRSLRVDPNFATSKELQKAAEPVILHTLLVLGDLVENILNEVTQTKKLCYDTLREYIDTSLWLFPLYIQAPDVCEQMFNFFHTVFDVLKSQMGSVYVEEAVKTFLSLFGENQLSQAIIEGGSTGSRVVEKFLSILTFIVSEPGPSFRKFVPSTLALCLDHIFPLVVDQQVSDIRAPMYNLLYHTLLNNWQYFFKSRLGSRLNNNGGGGEDEVANAEVFMKSMRTFGQSFLQPDIAVFRQNVESLESLNRRWKLYSKPIYLQYLMIEFLTVYLQVLVAKSHNLLREEIAVAIFNMASIDFAAFFDKFLAHFLVNTEPLDDNQRQLLAQQGFPRDTDLPTFVANLGRFINDLRFYQTMNSSLPGGSVSF